MRQLAFYKKINVLGNYGTFCDVGDAASEAEMTDHSVHYFGKESAGSTARRTSFGTNLIFRQNAAQPF